MVASKYLHDDGEEDEVFSDEWATAGGMEIKELNRKEIEFLEAIGWSLYVTDEEYNSMMDRVELEIARREVRGRGWATYTDLTVLSRAISVHHLVELLVDCCIKVSR